MPAARPARSRKARCRRDLDWRGPTSVNFGVLPQAHDEAPKPEYPTPFSPRRGGLCMTDFDTSFGLSRCSRRSSSGPCLRYQACWFEPTRPQLAGRICCLSSPSTIACLQFFVLPSVHLTLLAGDFVVGFRHCREWAASAAAVLVQTNSWSEEPRLAKTVAANHARESNERGSEQDR